MSYPWTKESLEEFLAAEMKGKKVVVDEPNPVFVKGVSLAHTGVISVAVIYKGYDSEKLRAVIVPFGVGMEPTA